jgi:hypothetical protein
VAKAIAFAAKVVAYMAKTGQNSLFCHQIT